MSSTKGDAFMTREEVKRAAVSRVRVPDEFSGVLDKSVAKWLLMFPEKYKFGPREVMSLERLLRRELQAAGHERGNRLREESRVQESEQ